jgi:sulfur carrier protein ThiS adenylyltransferase
MNEFSKDLISKLGESNFKKVRSERIGIAGLGGLGSNCAQLLVRAGFAKFTMADFDTIDCSNLDRQFYFADQVGQDKASALEANLRRIGPELDIKSAKIRIDRSNAAEFFKDCAVVAECFDSAENKSMIVSEMLSAGKFVVSVSGLGGYGGSDDIKIRRVKDNLVMVGDLRSDISNRPALSPRVMVAAAKQADAILEYVLGK